MPRIQHPASNDTRHKARPRRPAVASAAPDDSREPPWFAEVMNRHVIEPLIASIDGLRQGIKGLRQAVHELRHEMKIGQGKIRRLSAIVYNQNRSTRGAVRLEVVPFVDGTDPTEPPHNLPPLKSPRAVRDLDRVQRNAYYRGYLLPPQIRNPQGRVTQILIAIGSNRA